MTHPMPPTIEALPAPELPPEIDDRTIETARAMYIASTPHLTTPEQAIERADSFERAAVQAAQARREKRRALVTDYMAKIITHRLAALTPYVRELRASGAELSPLGHPSRCAVCDCSAPLWLGPEWQRGDASQPVRPGIALCAEHASIGGDE